MNLALENDKKRKVYRELFLFQLIFELFGQDETQEAEVQEMANSEFFLFVALVTIAIFILNYLIKVFST